METGIGLSCLRHESFSNFAFLCASPRSLVKQTGTKLCFRATPWLNLIILAALGFGSGQLPWRWLPFQHLISISLAVEADSGNEGVCACALFMGEQVQ